MISKLLILILILHLLLVLEGQRRNYDLFYYHPDDLFIDQGEVKAKGFFLELFDQKKNYYKFLSDKNYKSGRVQIYFFTPGSSI